jgi:hypothetical protein
MTLSNPLGLKHKPKEGFSVTEPRLNEITLGEEICEKLRNIYFPEKKNQEVYKHLARGLATMKTIASVYYPDLPLVERLKKIRSWTEDDIKEAVQDFKNNRR